MSVFDEEAKRLRLEAEILKAERAIVEAADKWRDTIQVEAMNRLIDAVDAWRKLRGNA